MSKQLTGKKFGLNTDGTYEYLEEFITGKNGQIVVIEYSAYEELEAQILSLENQLEHERTWE